ncbi:hypothetical protein [Silvibacterium acidisoli]|uniref:hypothetical protein n=1 Tax=Acidobacteriaceae bacterium ZG23-2 TaxID=2883246 RepID=UPI00406CF2F6
MPIRKRGTTWQADVITATGTRTRKQFTTKAEAQSFIASHQASQNPTSRRGKQSLASSRRTRRAVPATVSSSPTPSSPTSARSNLISLPRPTSKTSVPSGKASRRPRGEPTPRG